MRPFLIVLIACLISLAPLARGQNGVLFSTGHGELKLSDGRLVENLSKPELVCLVYFQAWARLDAACKQHGRTDCGASLKPKAQACALMN